MRDLEILRRFLSFPQREIRFLPAVPGIPLFQDPLLVLLFLQEIRWSLSHFHDGTAQPSGIDLHLSDSSRPGPRLPSWVHSAGQKFPWSPRKTLFSLYVLQKSYSPEQ